MATGQKTAQETVHLMVTGRIVAANARAANMIASAGVTSGANVNAGVILGAIAVVI